MVFLWDLTQSGNFAPVLRKNMLPPSSGREKLFQVDVELVGKKQTGQLYGEVGQSAMWTVEERASTGPIRGRFKNGPFKGQRWRMCKWTDVSYGLVKTPKDNQTVKNCNANLKAYA